MCLQIENLFEQVAWHRKFSPKFWPSLMRAFVCSLFIIRALFEPYSSSLKATEQAGSPTEEWSVSIFYLKLFKFSEKERVIRVTVRSPFEIVLKTLFTVSPDPVLWSAGGGEFR